MQLSILRREIAPAFEMTPEGFRQLVRMVPALMTPDNLATNASSALLILAGMLRQDRATINEEVRRLWDAAPVTRPSNKIERGCKTLGGALTMILAHPDVRRNLDHITVDREIPDVHLVWTGDQGRMIFAPYPPNEWVRRENERRHRGMGEMRSLWRPTFDKVAALIAADQEGRV
jgi:hypothetical protein